jgi:3'(2'), 5'-bisphosphate nucleotidase
MTTELEAAITAARLAGAYARQEYDGFTPIPNAPASISTHVDHQCQELILQHLRNHFPTDGIRAEEKTPSAENTPTGSDRCWVVDPIDGTRGFVMKNGQFSIMIGLTVANRVVLGVVYEPIIDRLTYATAGQGCFVIEGIGTTPKRCHVTTTVTLAAAKMAASHTKPGQPPKEVVQVLKPGSVHETYSAGIKLALVARGEADLYVNDHLNFHDWDICAGDILVTEAGGSVSLFSGEPVTYGGLGAKQRRGMVATNGHLQETVVALLKSI